MFFERVQPYKLKESVLSGLVLQIDLPVLILGMAGHDLDPRIRSGLTTEKTKAVDENSFASRRLSTHKNRYRAEFFLAIY